MTSREGAALHTSLMVRIPDKKNSEVCPPTTLTSHMVFSHLKQRQLKSRLDMQYETQLNNNQNLKLLSIYLYVPTLYCSL